MSLSKKIKRLFFAHTILSLSPVGDGEGGSVWVGASLLATSAHREGQGPLPVQGSYPTGKATDEAHADTNS